MSTESTYRRLVRRETHSSRAGIAITIAVLLILVLAWLGTEAVLAALGVAPLLLAPADLASSALQAASAPAGALVADRRGRDRARRADPRHRGHRARRPRPPRREHRTHRGRRRRPRDRPLARPHGQPRGRRVTRPGRRLRLQAPGPRPAHALLGLHAGQGTRSRRPSARSSPGYDCTPALTAKVTLAKDGKVGA
ncbi:hypothetical protein [Clavibacter zhangzhiyongii]|uniref:hypothetical protein n=1 Tax=Clavibacter zhangzhiyongii TaxID=2768071 RepID=UPI0039E0411B